MTGEEMHAAGVAKALAALTALADPAEAAVMAAYHKAPRRYLGVRVPLIEALVADWRAAATVEGRVRLADDLWQTDIHEARVAAAKLLTQARLRPDAAAWDAICGWVPGFDGWALADHATIAGQKRLLADPQRLAVVAEWSGHPNLWARRAALVITLPWAKMNHPKPADLAIRETALGWAARATAERDWFMQKAVAGWLRDLSKHDAARAQAFLDQHGPALKPFARKEAARFLPPTTPSPITPPRTPPPPTAL